MLLHFGIASNPSPNNWNFDGGGFCPGTYRIFNSTDNKLYAENCSTGTNDFAPATDLGALLTSSVFPAVAGGELVNLACGFFAVSTPIIYGRSSITLQGCGEKNDGFTGVGNGTLIVSKANNIVMVEATSQSPSVTCPTGLFTLCTGGTPIYSSKIKDLTLDIPAGITGDTPVNFAMSEAAPQTLLSTISIIVGTACSSACVILNGNEDSLVFDLSIGGVASNFDILWVVENGNVRIDQSTLASLEVGAQTVYVTGTTISEITLVGGTMNVYLSGDYFGNSQGNINGRFNLNGFTLEDISSIGVFYYLSVSIPFYIGAGTVSDSSFGGTSWFFSGADVWNNGGATLTTQISIGANPPISGATTPGTNHIHSGSTPTGFPFTVTSGNF